MKLGGTSWHPSLAHPGSSPGCVRELRIQDEEIVFHDLNLTAHGISHCPTCRDQPCQVPPPATPAHHSPLWLAHQGVGEGLRVCGLTLGNMGGCLAEWGPVPGL